jgi:hypothetical protein
VRYFASSAERPGSTKLQGSFAAAHESANGTTCQCLLIPEQRTRIAVRASSQNGFCAHPIARDHSHQSGGRACLNPSWTRPIDRAGGQLDQGSRPAVEPALECREFSLESADTRCDLSCKRTGKHYTNPIQCRLKRRCPLCLLAGSDLVKEE